MSKSNNRISYNTNHKRSETNSDYNIKFYIRHETVQLIGHVGQDPEVKNLEGGKKLAMIATNEVYYKENGDKVEKTGGIVNCLGENSRNH
jgi:hypothetical protein